jgi:hypothetical protein
MEPVQFGTPPAFFCSYDQCFCLSYCLKGLGSTIRKVQGLSHYCQPIWRYHHRTGCLMASHSIVDPGDAFRRDGFCVSIQQP